jgi:hypothetical protein
MPTIQFKNSTTSGNTPSSLQTGEVAINITNNKMWIGNASNVPVLVIQSLGNQDANNVSITGGSIAVTNLGTSTASTIGASSLSVGGNAISQVSNDTTMNNANYVNSATNSYGVTQNAVKTYHDNSLKGRLKNIYTFTSSGTYTKSGTDVNVIHVVLCGAGGGGTSYNINGGAGGYSETILTANSITTVAVTVGTGTAGAAYYANIGAGGSTSFGVYLSASGGFGADANYGHASGHGGIGYGGALNSRGGTDGGHTNNDQSNSNSSYDNMSQGFFGGGQATYHANQKNYGPAGGGTSGNSGTGAPGAGGASVASSHNGQGGFGGQNGICIVYEYK